MGHVGFGFPFCDVVRNALIESCAEVQVKVHPKGTYVNMEGPAFSTKAESLMHKEVFHAHVIGMTQMTEARLAREAEISFAVLAMSTDVDSWSDAPHVTVEQVVATAMANVANAQKVVAAAIPKIVAYNGETPEAQKALGGGGAIMTRRELIPAATLQRLWPIVSAYYPERKAESNHNFIVNFVVATSKVDGSKMSTSSDQCKHTCIVNVVTVTVNEFDGFQIWTPGQCQHGDLSFWQR